MRTRIGLLISTTFVAGAAFAQPGSLPANPPLAAPAPAVSTPAPATGSTAAAAAGTKTVEGLVVTPPPLPTKECAARDKECIAIVVAELKRLYPEELKRFCFQREMRNMRTTLDFGDAAPGQPAQTGSTYSSAAPLKIACAPDKK